MTLRRRESARQHSCVEGTNRSVCAFWALRVREPAHLRPGARPPEPARGARSAFTADSSMEAEQPMMLFHRTKI